MSGENRPTLSPEQFARVRAVFRKATEDGLSEAARAELVSRECGADEAVRVHVMELLGADAAAVTGLSPEGGGLVRRAMESSDGVESGVRGEGDESTGWIRSVPERIGRFSVRRMLGKGGMGVVYLATQTNPDREVALKLLRPKGTSAGLRGRFAREIRALGRLEHPGIARIYDAGQENTAEGEIAYFAMEYVRGQHLTAFARQEKLNVAARVALLARVADGVQHAHARGVLHRDLKPANVLVAAEGDGTGERVGERPRTRGPEAGEGTRAAASTVAGWQGGPQPKILDFGVARVLEPDTQHTVLTHHGLLVGTVAYMSPEQLSGDPDAVDTRSDIYALGVMLHELITGELPFDVEGKPLAEAARQISEGEAKGMRTRAGVGTLRVDRDLVTITRKAMARDKERRYSSAGELADDLRRYLRDEPITARAPTAVYQLMKFASRNRWLVVSSGAAVAAVVAGLVLSSVLYVREQRSSQEARRQASLSTAVREYLLRDLLTAAAPRRMGYEVRMLDVLKGAANGLEEKFKDYPEVEAEVRMDLTVAFDELGKPAESMEHARRARELFEQTRGEDASRTIEVITRMAQISRGQHDAAAAVAFASEALKRAKRSLPENDPVRGRVHSQLGASLMMAGRRAEALVELKLALPVFERCGAPCESDALSVLTWLQAALAEARDDRAALEYSRQILIRTDRLSGPENPEAIAARSNLVNALVNSGEFNEAAEIAEKLPALSIKTFPPGHPARAYTHLAALSAMMKAGRREEAERVGLKAHELSIESLGEFSWVTERSIQLMRHLYMNWPEHEQQLWEWQLLAIRLRLTVAKPDEHVASMKLFRDVVAEQRRQGVEMPIEIVMRKFWDRRDEVAPPGRGHRAVMLANASRVAAELGGKNIAAAALKRAKESLAAATDAAGASAAIAAAEGDAAPVK